MPNLFDRLYTTIDYEQAITPWDIVEQVIAQDCTPWYDPDPRFIKGLHELLFACFQNTAHWLKGQYYAQLVLEKLPQGIDADLLAVATALADGRSPEVESWNMGNPYASTWPAPVEQYCYPWNGKMLRWALEIKANKRLARRLNLKASGYQSPRRQMYLR